MTVSLVLGDLDLIDPQGSPFAVETLADGTNWGNPQPIEVAVRSLLQDGSIVVHQGDDNREVALRVVISAADSAALAEGEAALMAELYRPNTLTYTPADGWGPPTVFTVVTSSLAHVMDDLAEVRLSERHYSVRLMCEPFGRSEDEVVTEALAASGMTTTTVDTCAATTGWTGFINGASATVSNSSGANSVTQSAAYGSYTIAMQKTFAATTSSTKYLIVDWKPSVFTGGSSSALSVIGDGVTLPLQAQGPAPTLGYVRSHFYVAANSLAVTRFEWTSSVSRYANPVAPARTLSIDNVAVTDVTPSLGTGRQQYRTLDVSGSARTPAALSIESEGTAGLGEVLVYTYPADDTTHGYVPSLRQYRTAGNTVTADSTMVSGAHESLSGSGITFSIPMGLLPAGAYLLLVRVGTTGGSGGADITYTYETSLGGNQLGTTTTVSDTFIISPTYQIITLAKISLPTVALDPLTPATLSFTLSSVYGSGAHLDDAWLFNTDIGRLVKVDCGSGTAAVGGPARRIFVEPASAAAGPSIRVGHSADRSDSFHPESITSWQFPTFSPPQMNLFYVSTGAADSVASLRHFPRWHTHAVS